MGLECLEWIDQERMGLEYLGRMDQEWMDLECLEWVDQERMGLEYLGRIDQ